MFFNQTEGRMYVLCQNKSTLKMITSMLNFLRDNIFVEFSGQIFQQIVAIPKGTNWASLLAVLFVYSFEAEIIKGRVI